jgi:hypothetical protein
MSEHIKLSDYIPANKRGGYASFVFGAPDTFREMVLVPALSRGKTTVELDARGISSQFLCKVFGGLVERDQFSKEELKRNLEIKSGDESLPIEAWEYIDEASSILSESEIWKHLFGYTEDEFNELSENCQLLMLKGFARIVISIYERTPFTKDRKADINTLQGLIDLMNEQMTVRE